MKTNKQKVALFYNAQPKYGGWVTFTIHLYRSLKECGAEPYLFKIGKTSQRTRHFGDGIFYQNISPESVKELPGSFSKIITATDKHHIDATTVLIRSGSKLVIHDPTEMKGELMDVLREHSVEPISIRAANVSNLKAIGIPSRFIKHPYVQFNRELPPKTKLAAATSRVDFDKHTDIIVDANKRLEEKVKIWGALNGMYAYFKLDKIQPNWRQDYYGTFGNKYGQVFKILNPSKYMVDMSAIVGDGGGSQYTFLEGWDAGCVLVLNKKWGVAGDNTMNPGKNCLFVDGAEELREVLESNDDRTEIIEQGREKLKEFDGEQIAHQYMDYICAGSAPPPEIASRPSTEKKRSHVNVFSHVYEKEKWGKGKGSGTGSAPNYCERYMKYIQTVIDDGPDKMRVLDIGCGDWQFARYLRFPENVTYLGIDVVESVIARNIRDFQSKSIKFRCLDVRGSMDEVFKDAWDYVLMKDVLMHWTDAEVLPFLDDLIQRNIGCFICANAYRYFRSPEKNKLTREQTFNNTYSWAPIDLTAPPYDRFGFEHELFYPRGKYKQVLSLKIRAPR